MTLKCGLEVTQVHWKWYHLKAWNCFLFAFHSNYGRIFSHFGDIQRQAMAWPWNLGLGLRSFNFKVIENGAVRQTMYNFLLVRRCNYSFSFLFASILYHLRLRAIWRWILSWPSNVGYRSLKVIENGIISKLGYGFLFAFHSNYYDHIFSHFGDIQCQRMAWPWKPG